MPNPLCPRTDHPGHTTYVDYMAGCRCLPAREAHRIYRRDRRNGIVRLLPSVGAARRIRALATLGWDLPTLAAHAQVSVAVLRKLTPADGQRLVSPSTDAKVRVVYDRLSMRFGPSTHTAQRARCAGWPPPLAWDDDDLDQPDALPNEQLFWTHWPVTLPRTANSADGVEVRQS